MTGGPVAIVDIGSNSVRLVAYERVVARPDADLQREGAVRPRPWREHDRAVGGRRDESRPDGLAGFQDPMPQTCRSATSMSSRPRQRAMRVTEPISSPLRPSALGSEIELIGGAREAELSALGVASGFHGADGIVGDMGGGSLELIGLKGMSLGKGVSLPLGGLALLDASRSSPKRAHRIARQHPRHGGADQEPSRPHLLCRGRHLAGAGQAAHDAAQLSAQRHARLRDPGRRGERLRQPRRTRQCRQPEFHRGRLRGPPPAFVLRRGGARGDHPSGPAQGCRDFGHGGQGGPAVRAPVGGRAVPRPAAVGRT